MRKKVMIASGGTGGHLFPAQQLAEMLKEDSEILFAGHKISSSPFFEKEKIPFEEITAHPLKKGFFLGVWKGFWEAIKSIRRFGPDVVVGFGSYHTFPILLATVVLRKKLVLFEANSSLGKVNRLFRPFAFAIAYQFPFSTQKGILVPWLPWKRDIKQRDRAEAKKYYGLDPSQNTILVFGGSQGAAFLNNIAPLAIANLKEKYQVIHLSGPVDAEAVRMRYEQLNVTACVKSFEKEMVNAYSASDLALCRSGAGTIAELIRYELPALLIPYPFATENHQRKNGEYLTDKIGGARLIDQSEATLSKLVEELNILDHEKEVKKVRLHEAKSEDRPRVHLAEVIRTTV